VPGAVRFRVGISGKVVAGSSTSQGEPMSINKVTEAEILRLFNAEG